MAVWSFAVFAAICVTFWLLVRFAMGIAEVERRRGVVDRQMVDALKRLNHPTNQQEAGD
jgi:hypothetical protein